MVLRAGISVRQVNAYHQSSSLLFQFILAEFIEAFEQVQHLDALCNRKPTPLSQEISSQQNKFPRPQIDHALEKLVGATRDYMRLFSWNFTEGTLAKLKIYCTLLQQNGDSSEKELIAMQHYAEKIWQGYLSAIDAIREAPEERTAFFSAIDKASSAMQRFSKLIVRIIHHFRDDENVIFCVLRQKEQLDKLYGNRFVAKLLIKMFPKGLKEALHFTSIKYKERSFENILPKIAVKIAELEASTS